MVSYLMLAHQDCNCFLGQLLKYDAKYYSSNVTWSRLFANCELISGGRKNVEFSTQLNWEAEKKKLTIFGSFTTKHKQYLKKANKL